MEGITPIDFTSNTDFINYLLDEGTYYYAVVADNFVDNSLTSRLAYVEYKIPHLREFAIITSLLVSTVIISFLYLESEKSNEIFFSFYFIYTFLFFLSTKLPILL